MKIIVLGGAGDMARRAVRELAAEPGIEAVTVADVNLEAAQQLAGELGDKVKAVWVDANDPVALVDVIRGHDAAASGIGPFYRYEVKVARAAIEAGVPYVSLCDDYDAAAGALRLDADARAAGVTVITGLGWTPGVSNLLAVKAARQLDIVDEVNVAWGSSASDSNGYAVILHTLHIFTGLIPTFRKGGWVAVRAGSEKETILFPEPLGSVNCYHLGHPEPVTLPHFMPGVRTVTLKGGLAEQPLNDLGLWLARLRLTDTPAKKDAVGRLIKTLLPALSNLGKPEQPCSGVRVDVGGWREGAYRQLSYGATAHMAELTGLPLAIGALMLARGDVHRPGVAGPETAIDPDVFFAELERRGVSVVDMTGEWPETPARPSGPSRGTLALGLAALGLASLILLRRGRCRDCC